MSLSAFVMASITQVGVKVTPSLTANAQFCLAAATDPYALSLVSLALARLGLRQKALEAVQNLMRHATIHNDLLHWGQPGKNLQFKYWVFYKVICFLNGFPLIFLIKQQSLVQSHFYVSMVN